MKMKKVFVFILIIVGVFGLSAESDFLKVEPNDLLEVDNSWVTIIGDECVFDNNTHAAFTSMEEYGNRSFIAFREAGSHRPTPTDKGRVKVLEQTERGWVTNHIFSKDGVDLRDPFMINWDNRLLLYTDVYYSELLNGEWTELKPINHNAPYIPSIWKKREHQGLLYGIANSGGKWPILMKSEDGVNWCVVCEYKIGGNATEADMVFVEDTLYTCIRIDTPVGSNSLWGKSKYPFTSCKWTVMDVSVASPEMIKHSDSIFLLAGREYDYHNKEGKDARYISLFVLDRNGLVQDRVLIDKYTADQGYPSFVKKNNKQYTMSYYVGTNTATKVRLLTFEVNEAKQNVSSISHKQ